MNQITFKLVAEHLNKNNGKFNEQFENPQDAKNNKKSLNLWFKFQLKLLKTYKKNCG